MPETNSKNGKVYKTVSLIGGLIIIFVFLWAAVNDYFDKSAKVLANTKTLFSIIGILMAGIIYLVSLVRSYEPELNRLRQENMVQDSTIIHQKERINTLDDKLYQLRISYQEKVLTKVLTSD